MEKYLTKEMLDYYAVHRKLKNDPRITKVGRFLRCSCIDELPQLFNVIKGEMSLIGPRPMLQDEVIDYGSAFNTYISIRPGITGLWQVQNKQSYMMSTRAISDMQYCRDMSLKSDLRIFYGTVKVMFMRKGA
jgi:lipopolysaccharide/colanic/teichoic acid biosynthesis glycosyltransferase